MSGYIKKVLQKLKTPKPPKPQHAPYPIPQKHSEKAVQELDSVDESLKATEEEVLKIQQVVGSILYYSQAADLTALRSLYTLDREQLEATKKTITKKSDC